MGETSESACKQTTMNHVQNSTAKSVSTQMTNLTRSSVKSQWQRLHYT